MSQRVSAITTSVARTGGADVGEFSASGVTVCSLQSCKQSEFLPFTCALCKAAFCLAHASPARHACAVAGAADHTVFVCPLCKKGVDNVAGEDVNTTFARHEASAACRAARKAPAKPRCAAPGCREALQSHTAFDCKGCGAKFCVSHRTDLSHACKGPPRPARSGLSRLLGGGGGGGGAGASAAPAPAPKKPAPPPPIRVPDHVRDTAERRKQQGAAGGGGSSGSASPKSPHSPCANA